MLTIKNKKDSIDIAETNFWSSEYNARGLAYLSYYNKALRLLLPISVLNDWRPEIKTGKSVTIEPPVRPGYFNNIDIVFNDDSSNPFWAGWGSP